MITFLIIAGVVVGFVIFFIDLDEWGAALATLIIGGFVGWLVFVFVGYIITMSTHGGEGEDSGGFTVLSTETRELRALDTGGTQYSGAFFLGSGYIDGDKSYEYIQRYGNGWQVKTTTVDNAAVYELPAGEEPRVERSRIRGSWWWTWTSVWSTRSFYVPEGSVQQPDYTVGVGAE